MYCNVALDIYFLVTRVAPISKCHIKPGWLPLHLQFSQVLLHVSLLSHLIFVSDENPYSQRWCVENCFKRPRLWGGGGDFSISFSDRNTDHIKTQVNIGTLYLTTAFPRNRNPPLSSDLKSKSDTIVVNGSLTRTFKARKYFLIPFHVPPKP
jgi:hypothetical protein